MGRASVVELHEHARFNVISSFGGAVMTGLKVAGMGYIRQACTSPSLISSEAQPMPCLTVAGGSA